MSTRAVFTFSDPETKGRPLLVYKHHDGYPSGAIHDLMRARDSGLSWQLPRFEADEFAAAFVAANKTQGGGVRLLGSGDWSRLAPSDVEFAYHVTQFDSGHINVVGFEVEPVGPDGVLVAVSRVLSPTRLRDLSLLSLTA